MASKQLTINAFHASALLMYLTALIRYEFLPPMPNKTERENFAGRLKYLTYWNVWIQFFYFGLSLYIDLDKPLFRKYIRIIQLRDKVFASLALPYGLFVFSVFWTLYSVNRELIFPRVLDSIFPPWLNHVSHTAIVPVLLFEAYIIRHHHPKWEEGIKLTLLLGLAYISWVLFLGFGMDIWVYPILKILSWGMRGVFFFGCFLFLLMLYTIGEQINKIMWGLNNR